MSEIYADPIIEILRLAYRRGLVLLQERESERQADPKPIENKKDLPDEKEYANRLSSALF